MLVVNELVVSDVVERLLVDWLECVEADRDCVILELVLLVVADCVEDDSEVVEALSVDELLADTEVVVADCVDDEDLLVVVTEETDSDVVLIDCVDELLDDVLELDDLVDEDEDISSQDSKQKKPSRSPNWPTPISACCVLNRNAWVLSVTPPRTSTRRASYQRLSGRLMSCVVAEAALTSEERSVAGSSVRS